jgi:hypothetical protein
MSSDCPMRERPEVINYQHFLLSLSSNHFTFFVFFSLFSGLTETENESKPNLILPPLLTALAPRENKQHWQELEN